MRIAVGCAAAVFSVLGLTIADAADNEAPEGAFNFESYAAVLERFVDDEGMVDYEGLKADGGALENLLEAMAALDRGTFDLWSDDAKVAFWINAYNALTLDAIIDHYPIKASFVRSLRYPKNSIRQIPGVWDKLEWAVMGRKMTLDDIEHETLRADFNEPRIHVALVCAAMGCPPLRNEPYVGERLDEQLDDQAGKFFANPAKLRVDRDAGRLYLSPIFDWFGEDFVKTYGTDEKFEWYGEVERAVVSFVSRYLSKDDGEYLESRELSIRHLDYDWSLNQQRE